MADAGLPRSDFYVYVIFRPNGVPCYVGKGRGKRDKFHETKGSHNAHLNAIIRLAGGSLPTVRTRSGITESEAFETEMLLIHIIGREIVGGPLVNQSDGGEGPTGIIRSAGYREKQRKSQTGKRASQNQRLNQSKSHLERRGRALEDIGQDGLRLTKFQRRLLNKPALTRDEIGELTRLRNVGNAYGIGNKRSPEGQAVVTQSVIASNKARNRTGKPTVHKGPQPWLDEGMSRTSWYRKRAMPDDRTRISEANRGRKTPVSV